MFRGIRQNSTGFATWPALDLGIAAYSERRRFEGRWASTSVRGTACTPAIPAPTARAASCGTSPTSTRRSAFGFGGGTSLQHHLHRLHQPEQRLHHGQGNHVQVRASMTAEVSGKAAVKPYIVDRAGVRHRHRHRPGRRWRRMLAPTWRSGFAPGYYGLSQASIAFPIKVGISLSDYYENPLTGEDSKFGFFSIAGIVTVPLGGTTQLRRRGTFTAA